MKRGEKNKKNLPDVKEFTAIKTSPAIPKPISTRLYNK